MKGVPDKIMPYESMPCAPESRVSTIDTLFVNCGEKSGRIELCLGDLSTLDVHNEVDVLVVSAFPNVYDPVPGSLIGDLHYKGISVKDLAADKDVDLRESFSCWLSRPLRERFPSVHFGRLLCFEPRVKGPPAQLVGDIFRSLAPFAAGEPPLSRIAMPLVASGYQGVPPSVMLSLLVENAVRWISIGFPVSCLKIVLHTPDKQRLASRIEDMARAFHDNYCAGSGVARRGDSLRKARKILPCIGYDIRPAKAAQQPTRLPVSVLEALARAGHDRWMRERQGLGWRFGPRMDKESKTNPHLVAWDRLEERVKEYDREEARWLLAHCESEGYDVYPISACSDAQEHDESVPDLCRLFDELKRAYGSMLPTAEHRDLYDVFLSHAHRDDREASVIQQMLSVDSALRIYIDRQNLHPGSAWQRELFEALDSSRKVVALLSPFYLASKVCVEEFNIALCRQRESSARILAPIYLYDARLPTYMQMVHFWDCRPFDRKKLEMACAELAADLR